MSEVAVAGEVVVPVVPVVPVVNVEDLKNSLAFEKGKNKVLLDEVRKLEDEIVNRTVEEFDAVISDQSREFWRGQLLSNRDEAMVALGELQLAKQGGVDGATRRPLHNRAIARPVPPAVVAGAAGGGADNPADVRAVKVRNRAHAIAKTERLAFSEAFRRAEREFGE